MASVMAAGDGAALGGRSAARAWGFLDHHTTTDVLRTSASNSRRSKLPVDGEHNRRYVAIHRVRELPAWEVTAVSGIPVTSVERTLWDLSALISERRFIRAFLEADRLGLIDDLALVRRGQKTQGHRGGAAFSRMVKRRIPDVDQTRSVLEALFLKLCRDQGLPHPEVNIRILGLEVDFVWSESRVVVELDGYAFHRGREAFETDARRSNRLRAAGWTVLRFTWRMVTEEPDQVVTQIKAVVGPKGKRSA